MIAAMRQESIVFVMVLLFLALMVEKRQYDQNYSLRFSLAHPISPDNGCKYQLSKVSRLILIDSLILKVFMTNIWYRSCLIISYRATVQVMMKKLWL